MLKDYIEETNERTVINNQFPVLTASKNGVFLQDEYFKKQVASKDNIGYKIVHKGDFTYRAMSDTGYFYPNRLDCAEIGIVSPAYPVFHITKSDLLDSSYLKYYFKSNRFQYSISKYVQGSTRTSVKYHQLASTDIDLPNLEEQRKVVSLLDKTEQLLVLYNKQLSLLDNLVKSRFVELFGDLKTNNYGWPIRSFTEMATIDTNMIHSFEGFEDYPHIGIDSIEKDTGMISGYRTVKEDGVISGKYLFDDRHIIYSKIRPNLNKVALPNFVGVCSADAYPILPKANCCTREFLAFTMRSDIFLDYILAFSNRTNLPKVNKTQVEGFSCPLPDLDVQYSFSSFVKNVDKSKLAQVIYLR